MLQLADAATGEVMTEVDGEEVRLDVEHAGSGQVLLFLHGMEGRHRDTAVLDALAENFRVLAPSHPGFGLSPRPQWCESVADLAYLYLDWLERLDVRDVVLVGCGFGGWVATEIAVRDRSRIARVVLVDAVGVKFGDRLSRDIADVFALSRAELDRRSYGAGPGAPGPVAELTEEEVLHLARNEEALATYGWEPYLHNPGLRRWLGRVRVPALVVWGGDDGVVSPAYGRALAAALPDARFRLLDGAAHHAQINQPQRLADLVREHAK